MKLQSRLVIGFLIATCLPAAVAAGGGITMINKSTLAEVQRKVQQDINTAKLVYRHNLERLEYQLQFIALRSPIHEAILSGNLEVLEDLRVIIRSGTYVSVGPMALDMLTLVDTNGKVIYRAANPDAKGDVILWDSVVRVCLLERKPKSSTVIMPSTSSWRRTRSLRNACRSRSSRPRNPWRSKKRSSPRAWCSGPPIPSWTEAAGCSVPWWAASC
jgi:hypothetical protein